MWSQQRKHSCVLGHVEEPPPHRMHLQFFFTNSCISLHPFSTEGKMERNVTLHITETLIDLLMSCFLPTADCVMQAACLFLCRAAEVASDLKW